MGQISPQIQLRKEQLEWMEGEHKRSHQQEEEFREFGKEEQERKQWEQKLFFTFRIFMCTLRNQFYQSKCPFLLSLSLIAYLIFPLWNITHFYLEINCVDQKPKHCFHSSVFLNPTTSFTAFFCASPLDLNTKIMVSNTCMPGLTSISSRKYN